MELYGYAKKASGDKEDEKIDKGTAKHGKINRGLRFILWSISLRD